MTPLTALHTIALRFATTCTYDSLKIEDLARAGLEGGNMLLHLEDVTEMLSAMAGAYETSRDRGVATHNAILRMLNARLSTGTWVPLSLPPTYGIVDATKGAE